MKLFTKIKQYYCNHECDINDLKTISKEIPSFYDNVKLEFFPAVPRVVQAPCVKCGKVLQASCGLDLGCTWLKKPIKEDQ